MAKRKFNLTDKIVHSKNITTANTTSITTRRTIISPNKLAEPEYIEYIDYKDYIASENPNVETENIASSITPRTITTTLNTNPTTSSTENPNNEVSETLNKSEQIEYIDYRDYRLQNI